MSATSSSTAEWQEAEYPSTKSCRECIRLKLKCSRAPWPCRSCTEKGIQSLCPSHSLPTRPYKKRRKTANGRESEPTSSLQRSPSHAQEEENQTVPRTVDTLSRTVPLATDRGYERSGDSIATMPIGSTLMPEPPSTTRLPNDWSPPIARTSASPRQTKHALQTPRDNAADIYEERGLLVLERDGNHTYYGPNSHSFHLLQPSRDDRPTLPPLRRSTENVSPRNHKSGDSRDRGVFDIEPRRPADRKYASRLAAELRKNLIESPTSYMAVPGFQSPFDDESLVTDLAQRLPGSAIAKKAFSIYRQNIAWLYNPIFSLEEVWQDFCAFKERSHTPYSTSGPTSRPLSFHPHRLALVFAVLCLGSFFAVGKAVDRRKQEEAAERYYQHSWLALQCAGMLREKTLEQVQTILLIGHYLCNRDYGSSADACSPLLAMAGHSAICLGLHRDANIWELPERELQARRQLFWELYAVDCFRSLAYGRPCTVQDGHIDTQFPNAQPKDSLDHIFHTVKYRTVRILNRILEQGQRATTSYSAILTFDSSLRQLWSQLPPDFRMQRMGHARNDKLDLDRFAEYTAHPDDAQEQGIREMHTFLQGQTAMVNISQTLLHLHRPWFIRALRESKVMGSDANSLSHSPFAQSVVAVAESSKSIIRIAQAAFDVAPTMCLVWNYFWQHCFNAGICRCLQVLHDPSSLTATDAWADVQQSLAILFKARPENAGLVWTSKMALFKKLYESAECAMSGQAEQRSRSQDAPDQVGGIGDPPYSEGEAISNKAVLSDIAFPRPGEQLDDGTSHTPEAILSRNNLSNTAPLFIPSQDLFASWCDSLADSLLTPEQGRSFSGDLYRGETQQPTMSETTPQASLPSGSLQNADRGGSIGNSIDGNSTLLAKAGQGALDQLLADGHDTEHAFWRELFRGR